jgi:hypothetical protein
VKHHRHRLCLTAAALFTAVCAAGACQPGTTDLPDTGGAGGTGGAPAIDAAVTPDMPPDGPAGLPASPAQADVVAFLEAGRYKQTPWIAETAAPRPQSLRTSPHEQVRVWMNAPLVASLKGGRDGASDKDAGVTNPPHDRGSMAVKELYDEAGTMLVGVATMYKADEGPSPNSWVYYCHGPEGRCLTGRASPPTAPIYGRGTVVQCGFCHGGNIYTKAP